MLSKHITWINAKHIKTNNVIITSRLVPTRLHGSLAIWSSLCHLSVWKSGELRSKNSWVPHLPHFQAFIKIISTMHIFYFNKHHSDLQWHLTPFVQTVESLVSISNVMTQAKTSDKAWLFVSSLKLHDLSSWFLISRWDSILYQKIR